jgi:hypothetical protein
MNMSNPDAPVYIPSKGRWESRKTMKALDHLGVPYRVVVQPGEFEQYAAVIPREKLLTLPYNLGAGEVNDLGEGGLVFARNFVMDHAKAEGHKWFWIIDDNIDEFFRLNWSIKSVVKSGTIFKCAEQFVDRFDNVGQAGFQYYMFIPRKLAYQYPPVTFNSRIYSCTYMRTDTGHRWRGVFNDDTDLSLRIMKSGQSTILFNAFLARKIRTMVVKGGNTDIYQGTGRLEMARSLVEQHPEVTKIVYKFGHWQHSVDYSQFRGIDPQPKKEVYDAIPPGFDNHGLVLEHADVIQGRWRRDETPPTMEPPK